jgi:hypothetical protein
VIALATIPVNPPRRRLEVTSELKPDLDRSISGRFATLADDTRVKRTTAALESNGFRVLRAADAAEAKQMVLDLIPDGSQVHHGASQSLDVAGITAEIEGSGRYHHSGLGSSAWTARLRPTRSAVWALRRR